MMKESSNLLVPNELSAKFAVLATEISEAWKFFSQTIKNECDLPEINKRLIINAVTLVT